MSDIITNVGSTVRRMGRQLNTLLGRTGYRVARVNTALNPTSMDAGLKRAAARNLGLGTVIDIGASDGQWSYRCREHFPNARYLLVEANAYHVAGLNAFKQRVPGSDYVLAAAGDKVGRLYFAGENPLGGQAMSTQEAGATEVAATTIDHEVATRGLPGPFLVKLDTHGFEVPILEGAKQTLQRTNLIVIEVYNFTLTKGALRFQEICEYLAPLQFRPIDLCDPMYRPKDGAFWQCDMFFARSDRPEFSSNSYE